MIRILLATATTAAVSAFAYRAWRSGKLDATIERFFGPAQPAFALDQATEPANVSKPAPAHPWPIDKRALPVAAD
jgi:hypothetical protein